MKIKKLLLLLLCVGFCAVSYPLTTSSFPGTELQQKKNIVKGKVTDDTGEPLPGVNVKVKGSPRVAISDANGLSSLEDPITATLQFSMIGFKVSEPAASKDELSVQMKPDSEMSDDEQSEHLMERLVMIK